jgi:flavin reductase (DIM6/NTAB) family NADH-FMN oxidoreductase RutF
MRRSRDFARRFFAARCIGCFVYAQFDLSAVEARRREVHGFHRGAGMYHFIYEGSPMDRPAMDSINDSSLFNELQFRSLMRSMVSGVTVITTSHQGHPHGMTATAFSSVCAEPPTILIVLNRSTRTHPLISASRHFVVNLLAEEQREMGQRFAGKHDDQFREVKYTENSFGIPVIDGAAASLECETVSEVNFGTHTIFIGKVIRGATSEVSPLVYHNGSYKGVADLTIG